MISSRSVNSHSFPYVIRSRAPLRLGLAGGGTDIPSFYESHNGGCVLNIALNLFACCSIIPTNLNKIRFFSQDQNECFETEVTNYIEPTGALKLHKAAYNRIVKEFCNSEPLGSFDMFTCVDVPSGSGLGGSSTLMVSILQAFKELLNLPLGIYDIAFLAYQTERKDLGLQGGKQDQYSATFGGVNFMEFNPDDTVLVNPLKLSSPVLRELEQALILYFTGASRDSGAIIEEQVKGLGDSNNTTLSYMKIIKEQAYVMKRGLLTWDIDLIRQSMVTSWEAKKNSASKISNSSIDKLYDEIMQAGAYCAKISGAGGGGFMTILVDPVKRWQVINMLKKHPGYVVPCSLSTEGVSSWRVMK